MDVSSDPIEGAVEASFDVVEVADRYLACWARWPIVA